MVPDSVIESVERLLGEWKDLRVHYAPLPEEARTGSFTGSDEFSLQGSVKRWLTSSFPDGLFLHQHAALAHILAGKNTVVATKTSSGKSLIFSVPVLNSLAVNPQTSALFLFPQKALANDQLLKLKDWTNSILRDQSVPQRSQFLVSRYDGGTQTDQRPLVRDQVQLLLTNPDMLHRAILPWHERNWHRFFRQLRYVVIDECHEY
ncbi:MAG: DEAD/DEAH box helicase, partial [Gemmataceae bacterium]|nr:DEAD/DEAH box helicase [Gemmataceae bacterium]